MRHAVESHRQRDPHREDDQPDVGPRVGEHPQPDGTAGQVPAVALVLVAYGPTLVHQLSEQVLIPGLKLW